LEIDARRANSLEPGEGEREDPKKFMLASSDVRGDRLLNCGKMQENTKESCDKVLSRFFVSLRARGNGAKERETS